MRELPDLTVGDQVGGKVTRVDHSFGLVLARDLAVRLQGVLVQVAGACALPGAGRPTARLVAELKGSLLHRAVGLNGAGSVSR